MDVWRDKEFVNRFNDVYKISSKEMSYSIKTLSLQQCDNLIDFGCGSGELLKAVASKVNSAIGIDHSVEQIKRASINLKELTNVKVIRAEFLNCETPEYKQTRGHARKSLHHLNDADKILFFQRISHFFESGALFVIEDGVYDFPKNEVSKRMPEIIKQASLHYGSRWELMKKDFLYYLSEEFPTDHISWEQALNAGGFSVISRVQQTCFFGTIIAKKESK